MKIRVAGSTLAVVVLGVVLHFAWEWSGRSSVVAVVAAVNESTWEHLKLAFWPALLLTPIQRRLYGPAPGWLTAAAAWSLLPPVLIVVVFYGYTEVLGTHYLAADIATFVIAVFVGELAGHAMLPMRGTPAVRASAIVALTIAAVAFATLTFAPPPYFLFEVPAGSRP